MGCAASLRSTWILLFSPFLTRFPGNSDAWCLLRCPWCFASRASNPASPPFRASSWRSRTVSSKIARCSAVSKLIVADVRDRRVRSERARGARRAGGLGLRSRATRSHGSGVAPARRLPEEDVHVEVATARDAAGGSAREANATKRACCERVRIWIEGGRGAGDGQANATGGGGARVGSNARGARFGTPREGRPGRKRAGGKKNDGDGVIVSTRTWPPRGTSGAREVDRDGRREVVRRLPRARGRGAGNAGAPRGWSK